jgi:NhaP-type Na+/H+ or K+/H+ antiporter
MYANLAILAIFIFVYSVIAGRVERLPISGPIVFVAFGLVCGPAGLGVLRLEITAEGLRLVAELALAVVLFSDAARIRLTVLEHSRQIPARLLLIGLPLTILLGTWVGRIFFPDLPLIEVAILATMLAPTDAALGSSVVTNPKVPGEIREALNVESGLNDGICVPVLFLLLALETQAETLTGGASLALRLVVEEIGIGLICGLVLAGLGWWLVKRLSGGSWVDEGWRQIAGLALALGCFTSAQALGGSGFIASFSGGLLFGALARSQKAKLLHTAEGIGDLLSLATWVAFGATVVGQMMERITWPVVAYAVLSLTVIRMAPVLVSLIGSPLRARARLFIGWFGPRGLASIVFIVIVLNHELSGHETLSLVVVCTVVLSILAHGLSANPLVEALAARSSKPGP